MSSRVETLPLLAAGERLDPLRRDGLALIQRCDAPCFSLDALLLADFVLRHLPRDPRQITELGCSSGVICLLLAAALPQARIIGIELMAPMAELARRNVDLNGMAGQIRVEQGDLRQAERFVAKGSQDVLVANPPFFPVRGGRVSQDPLFAAFRTEVHCCLEDIFVQAAALLRSNGRFFLIQRPGRLAEACYLAARYRLQPRRLRLVQPFAAQNANHFLMQMVKEGREELVVEPPLVIYERPGQYTAAAAHSLAAQTESYII